MPLDRFCRSTDVMCGRQVAAVKKAGRADRKRVSSCRTLTRGRWSSDEAIERVSRAKEELNRSDV